MPMMAYVRNGSYNSDRRSVNTDFKLINSHIKSIRWVMFFLAFLASFFTKKRPDFFSKSGRFLLPYFFTNDL